MGTVVVKGLTSVLREERTSKHEKQSSEVFCKNNVLKNFTKFKGEHLRQSLFFNKVAGLGPASLLKTRL